MGPVPPPSGSKLRDVGSRSVRFSRTWNFQKKFTIRIGVEKVGRKSAADRAHERAAEFKRLMAAEGLSRAALSRRLGVSRAWVTKVLGVL